MCIGVLTLGLWPVYWVRCGVAGSTSSFSECCDVSEKRVPLYIWLIRVEIQRAEDFLIKMDYLHVKIGQDFIVILFF